ncbi:MAG: metallophosphoesterase [Alistipes putredinis]
MNRLVDTINALRPDLVVFSGDLVNVRSTELTSDVLAILGRLRAPYGVISTLGNHDVGLYGSKIPSPCRVLKTTGR